jgi:hypothetical protein
MRLKRFCTMSFICASTAATGPLRASKTGNTVSATIHTGSIRSHFDTKLCGESLWDSVVFDVYLRMTLPRPSDS